MSSWQTKVTGDSFDPNVKVIFLFNCDAVTIVVGGVVSTTQEKEAVSKLPARSVLLTVKVWLPSAIPESSDGLTQAAKPAPQHNLPTQLTSFVGREKELAEVERLVAANRLVTLTGSGGCGKTRLSIEAANVLLAEFPNGVWLIELAPLADPALVPGTVAATLGLPEEVGRLVQTALTGFLRAKTVLLVLDNCEHLIEACAQLSESLLHACPTLRILASSREALGIAGEVAYRVPSLTVPDPAHVPSLSDMLHLESVRLFVERAAAAKAGFALTEQNTRAVAQICTRLDGIPLAIELAATRVKALSVEQIAARLDDRFRLLTGGSRTALPRQQTLRALIDWSHGLLSGPERVLLRRLSIFAGGWTLETAEEVASSSEQGASAAATDAFRSPTRTELPGAPFDLARRDILDLLTGLVDKSLVIVEDMDGEARYRMLETIRQYARDKLLEAGEDEPARNRHLEFFVRLGDLFDANIMGPEDERWSTRLETELDNVRAAIDWSIESDEVLSALRLAGSLRVFWFRRHPAEAIQRVGEILAMPEAAVRSSARAWALCCYGVLFMFLGQPEKYAAGRQLFEEMLGIAKEVGDERATINALDWLGWVLSAMGNFAAAQPLLTEALSRARLTGDQYSIGVTQWNLGEVAFSQDKIEAAQTLFEAGAATLRAHGAKNVLGGPTLRLGQVALRRGDHQQADKFIQESLTLLRETGDWRGVAMCLAAFAALRLAEGRVADAARLCGAVDALLESLHTGLLPQDHALYQRTLAELRSKLDTVAFNAAWADGQALKVEQAITLAVDEPHG